MAVATHRLPSEWAHELDRDPVAVWTVLELIDEAQQEKG